MQIPRPHLLVFCAGFTAAQAAAQSAPIAAAPPKAIDWKDLTKSGIPIRFYGYLRLDTYYDTARADSVILPTRVLAEGSAAAKTDDGEFFLDPRLTRLGIDVLPGEIGGAKVAGKIEMDFSNVPTGNVESRSGPRMRLAYIDVDHGDYGFRVGQDWDVISPLFPAVNHETLMWNAGNLGDRRAQIQARWTPKDSGFGVRASLGLTGAINAQDLDPASAGGAKDGFDAGMPHLQVRANWKGDMLVEKKPTEFGAWSAVGRSESDAPPFGPGRYDTWLGGIDVELPLCANVSLRGEAWTGQMLGDFRGGIGQTVNPSNGEEIHSTGGWGELVYVASKTTRFHLGGTIDDPKNGDLLSGNPNRNLAGYVGTVVDWDCGVRTGFDTLYWETDYVGGGVGNMVRFDLYFQFNF